MNILVTGANGQLGNEMRIVTQNSRDQYLFSDVTGLEEKPSLRLDISDRDAVMAFVHDHEVKMIVNCAAYTNVDKAETEPELAERINATAVRYLAEAMRLVDGTLVHVSTDYVFGGGKYNTPCTEVLPANPTGMYGLTKLHGEQAILEVGCKHVILRTAWLYSEFGKNFVKTMLNLTATKPALKVVFDQVGTPTYAFDLANVIFDIVENRKFMRNEGVYHYSNEGVCSWYDFTKAIAEFSGHGQCDIQPCHSSEFPSPVVRPAYSVLDKTKLKSTFGLKVPYWTDSLRRCLSNMGELYQSGQ